LYSEHEAFRRLQNTFTKLEDADDKGERYFPHEFMYKMLLSGVLEEYYEIDLKDSWMYAAEKKIYQLLYQVGKIVQWEIYLHRM
jgi:deoxyhypusine synthase